MAKKRKRSGWVPKVLWRLFGNCARTLSDTIVSLIPPSPASTQCRCKGRRCIGCSGEDAMSFLLRPEDPYDYRHLLKNCFVVVSPDAPAFGAFHPDLRWTQIQIVRRTIEMLLCEQPVSTNLLCSGYDECNRSSSIMELLTCSTWAFLLKRVGDGLMVYLLKYTSIFVPHPQTIYQQVAGPPITHLCYRFSKRMPESEYFHPSPLQLGSRKKRKTIDGVSSLSDGENICSSLGCVDLSNSRADNDGKRIVELQQNSTEKTVKPKKHVRPFSWQRRRKRMQINFQETKISKPCTSVHMDNDSSSARLQCGLKPCSVQYHNKVPSQCLCCLKLEAPQKVKKWVHEINRQSILYKLECFSSVLPRNHVLNFLKPSFTGANLLFRDIFGLSDVNISPRWISCSHSSGSCIVGSACLYHSLIKTLKILIRRAQCCQYSRLLDKHCAVPSLEQNVTPHTCSILEGNESGNLLEPNKSYCLKSQVVSFIWAVCRSIVPPDLLGTTSNWRILRRNISKFIQLRRFEKFSLKQCMDKLKTSRFLLFSNNHSFCYLSNQNETGCRVDILKQKNRLDEASCIMKRRLLEKWIFWFFSCLVVPLVQANFYVTESEHGKQDVFYYRKSDWKKLTERVITSLEDRSYLYLDDASVRKILSKRSFGFSKLRLCPKEGRVRVLANLKSSSRMPSQKSLLKYKYCTMRKKSEVHSKRVKSRYFKSVNSLLRDLHAVLKGIQIKEPDKLGASVFNYNDVYRALCPFILGLKNGSTVMPCVYIVVSDVVNAFDSVDQDKLLGVMKNLILQDDYFLKQSHQVFCTNKSLRVHENLILTDDIIGGSSTTSDSPFFFRSSQSVLVNQECSKNIRRSDLYSDLIEHVKHNVLQLDEKFYLQVVGIPQGSVLSTLLCSFYYGHLERNVIYPFLEKACELVTENLSGTCLCHNASSTQIREESGVFSLSPKYVLLRFVDDFLFISTSKRQAANFFTRLQRGFREYNCFMNKEKSCLNFESDQLSGFQSNRVYVGEDGISFIRWSGLFIKCCSFEVQADYTRYLNSHLGSTQTVCWQDEPGHRLKEKLCRFMRPKCHPLFYDSNINSAAVVRLNIYQSFLLCAMKFHCYVRDLSDICKFRTNDYVASIENSFRYMYKLIKKRMHPRYLGSGFCPILQLEMGEVEWLGLNAYIRVLEKKQSRHKKLLSFMRSKLLVQKVAQSVSSQLEYAVDECHSSLLWKIKY